jgi:translation elongation factor P/translation initiation factor 5A
MKIAQEIRVGNVVMINGEPMVVQNMNTAALVVTQLWSK